MTQQLLPGAPHLARRGADLWLDGVRLADLAAEFGTPLYVYARSAMRDAAAAYQRALAGRPHLLCYAMKANSSLAVLKTFADLGLGFDIVSAGELARVLAAGGDPAKVVFSGVGKRPDDMRAALQAAEDAAITEAVRRQRACGLQSVTDGEFRRDWWHLDFLSQLDGVTLVDNGGQKFKIAGQSEQPPIASVTGRVGCSGPIMAEHFRFLAGAVAFADAAREKGDR